MSNQIKFREDLANYKIERKQLDEIIPFVNKELIDNLVKYPCYNVTNGATLLAHDADMKPEVVTAPFLFSNVFGEYMYLIDLQAVKSLVDTLIQQFNEFANDEGEINFGVTVNIAVIIRIESMIIGTMHMADLHDEGRLFMNDGGITFDGVFYSKEQMRRQFIYSLPWQVECLKASVKRERDGIVECNDGSEEGVPSLHDIYEVFFNHALMQAADIVNNGVLN